MEGYGTGRTESLLGVVLEGLRDLRAGVFVNFKVV